MSESISAALDTTDKEVEEEYRSSEDEDFNPDAVATTTTAEDAESSESDSEVGRAPQHEADKKRKASRLGEENDDDGADLDFANSGDEATIRTAKRRRRKNKGQRKTGEDDDEDGDGNGYDEIGGEGGLVKTRAQRAREAKESKPLVDAAGSTVDVDALWANMNKSSTPKATSTMGQRAGGEQDLQAGQGKNENNGLAGSHNSIISTEPSKVDNTNSTTTTTDTTHSQNHINNNDDDDKETITIKRAYEFAGETITEDKRVSRSSAEARLYLESLPSSSEKEKSATAVGVRRPKKRSSIFDPNPSHSSSPSSSLRPPNTTTTTTKLNTVEKSKLDWAGFVDKEGISEELDEHSRAKEGYLGRMDFLGRVQAQREDAAKGGLVRKA